MAQSIPARSFTRQPPARASLAPSASFPWKRGPETPEYPCQTSAKMRDFGALAQTGAAESPINSMDTDY